MTVTRKATVSLWASTPASTAWDPPLLERLDSHFAFYHRQWWCHRRLFDRFKRLHAWSNGLALLVVAAGLVVGPVLENSLLVACLAAVGTLVKGWNDFKKWGWKMQMSRFAYTTYAKTLIELRTTVCSEPRDDLDDFLIKMQTLDDVVTDFAPPVPDRCVLEYGRRYDHCPLTTLDGQSIKGRGEVAPETLECLDARSDGPREEVEEEKEARREEEEEVNAADYFPCWLSPSPPSPPPEKPPL